jgi:hypothetical protein
VLPAARADRRGKLSVGLFDGLPGRGQVVERRGEVAGVTLLGPRRQRHRQGDALEQTGELLPLLRGQLAAVADSARERAGIGGPRVSTMDGLDGLRLSADCPQDSPRTVNEYNRS